MIIWLASSSICIFPSLLKREEIEGESWQMRAYFKVNTFFSGLKTSKFSTKGVILLKW